jgi:hypothetical protein
MSDIRTMVRGVYAIQKLRIQTGNRIVGNFKAKLGQAPSKPEEELGAEEVKILKNLREHYIKITDGVVGFPKHATFKGDSTISSFTELCLISQYLDLEDSETRHFARLGAILRDYPIYTEFLSKVKGIGPAMAGVIVSEIDITKAKYPSSLWKLAGIDVAADGKGRSRRKEHLVERDYTDRDGNPARRVGITFNPLLKTKLTGVLAASFLRSGNEKYSKIYDDYKNRLENHPKWKDESKGHRHRAALRYVCKQFIIDLYNAWRPLEGLPVSPTYAEAKLGIVHGEAKNHETSERNERVNDKQTPEEQERVKRGKATNEGERVKSNQTTNKIERAARLKSP